MNFAADQQDTGLARFEAFHSRMDKARKLRKAERISLVANLVEAGMKTRPGLLELQRGFGLGLKVQMLFLFLLFVLVVVLVVALQVLSSRVRSTC